MPQDTQDGTANGAYASDAAGLNTVYRYWVEVPAGLPRIRVEIFDADIGRGGAAEADAGRDRDRGGGFSTTATYQLFKPDGTLVGTIGPCDSATCTDNAWTTLFNSNAAADRAAVGHWELRVTMGGPAGNN